jgi:hypothetical protein
MATEVRGTAGMMAARGMDAAAGAAAMTIGTNENDPTGATGNSTDRLTGATVERTGGAFEVVYPDGYKEELRGGRFEMKDPRGRTVIERQATPEDIERLGRLLR